MRVNKPRDSFAEPVFMPEPVHPRRLVGVIEGYQAQMKHRKTWGTPEFVRTELGAHLESQGYVKVCQEVIEACGQQMTVQVWKVRGV